MIEPKSKKRMGSARDAEHEGLMLSIGNVFYPGIGLIVDGQLLSRLLTMKVGNRAKHIRIWLNAIYADEYSRNQIAKEMFRSNQSLKNVEECLTPLRPSTIETVSNFYFEKYGVPKQVFESGVTAEDIRGFYLGRKSDKSIFFDEYYGNHSAAHYLDERYSPDWLSEDDTGKYVFRNDEFDPDGYDVEHLDNGCRLDRIRVEIRIKGFQDSGGRLLWERIIGEQEVISFEDLKFFEEVTLKQIKLLSRRYREVLNLKMKLLGREALANAKRLHYQGKHVDSSE